MGRERKGRGRGCSMWGWVGAEAAEQPGTAWL